jgi:hypothetical protein
LFGLSFEFGSELTTLSSFDFQAGNRLALQLRHISPRALRRDSAFPVALPPEWTKRSAMDNQAIDRAFYGLTALAFAAAGIFLRMQGSTEPLHKSS